MTRLRPLPLIMVAIVAVLAGWLLARSLQRPGADSAAIPLTNGTLLEPARALPEFSLLDTAEQPFGNAQLHGRWSVLFFGFATCPDVCPTTLALLAQVKQALADLPAEQQPQIVFLSVDPQRDTPAALRSYVKFFDPTFIGLTGEQPQVDAFTRGLGVPVMIRPLDNGGYTVDHSAALFLIDRQGRLRALFSAPHTQEALVTDLRTLLARHD